MNALDIILIIAAIVAAVIGFKKGLIVQACEIAGILIGVFLAFRLGNLFGDWLNIGERFAPVLNFVLILAAAVIATALIGRMFSAVVRKTVLSIVERMGGLVLGVALWGLMCGIALKYTEKINDNYNLFNKEFFAGSVLYGPLSGAVNTIFPYLVDKGEKLIEEAKSGGPATNPFNGRNGDGEESPETPGI